MVIIERVPNQTNDAVGEMEVPAGTVAQLVKKGPLIGLRFVGPHVYDSRGTAALAARRLGKPEPDPEDEKIAAQIHAQMASAAWNGFFVGATVASCAWFLGWLLLKGWAS